MTFWSKPFSEGYVCVWFLLYLTARIIKDSFTCCYRHSVRALLFNRSYIALTLIFNLRDQNEVFSLKDFFTWRIILSSIIDLFVLSFIIRAFSLSVECFHVLYCSTNCKTNRATPFLEKHLDFEITWLMWNVNIAMMFPPWLKNINPYLGRLLMI